MGCCEARPNPKHLSYPEQEQKLQQLNFYFSDMEVEDEIDKMVEDYLNASRVSPKKLAQNIQKETGNPFLEHELSFKQNMHAKKRSLDVQLKKKSYIESGCPSSREKSFATDIHLNQK